MLNEDRRVYNTIEFIYGQVGGMLEEKKKMMKEIVDLELGRDALIFDFFKYSKEDLYSLRSLIYSSDYAAAHQLQDKAIINSLHEANANLKKQDFNQPDISLRFIKTIRATIEYILSSTQLCLPKFKNETIFCVRLKII